LFAFVPFSALLHLLLIRFAFGDAHEGEERSGDAQPSCIK